MLLLICEIAHSWMNFKLWSSSYKILFMNRGRNVSQSHYSKMVAPNPSPRFLFFFPKGEKKNSRPQHCDNYNNHTSHGFYSIVLHRLQCRKRIISEYLPWARHCAKCVDYQGDEVRFLSSGAYKLAGEGRHKPQSEINSHKWTAWSVSATQGDWSAFL